MAWWLFVVGGAFISFGRSLLPVGRVDLSSSRVLLIQKNGSNNKGSTNDNTNYNYSYCSKSNYNYRYDSNTNYKYGYDSNTNYKYDNKNNKRTKGNYRNRWCLCRGY